MFDENEMRKYKEFGDVLEIYEILDCMESHVYALLGVLKRKKLVLDKYTKRDIDNYYSNLIGMFEEFSNIEKKSCRYLTFSHATYDLDYYVKRGNFDNYTINEEKYKNNDKLFSVIENNTRMKKLVEYIDFLDEIYKNVVNESIRIEELHCGYVSKLDLEELNEPFRVRINLINRRLTNMALDQKEKVLSPYTALRENKLHLHHNFLSFLLNSFYLPHLYFSLTLYSAKINNTITRYVGRDELEYLFKIRNIANNYIVKITKKYLFKEFNKCYENFCIKSMKLDGLNFLKYLNDECKKGNEVIKRYYSLSLLSFENSIKDISVEYNKQNYRKIQKDNDTIERFMYKVKLNEREYIKEVVEPFFNK